MQDSGPDPNDLLAWLTAMQAIAWHMLRDPAAVLRAGAGGNDGMGWIDLCCLWGERNPGEAGEGPLPPVQPFQRAKAALVRWARAGRLPSKATVRQTGASRALDADVWRRLDLAEADGEGRGMDAFPTFPNGNPDGAPGRTFGDVRFERDALLRLCAAERVAAEPAPSRKADPDRPFWTATEALTWLAFGTPETWDELTARGEAFRRAWRCDPPAADVLTLLEARALQRDEATATGPFYPWCPEVRALPGGPAIVAGWHSPFASPPRWHEGPHGRGRVPGAPELARAIRADRRRELGRLVGFPELAEMLRADLAEQARRRAALDAATRELRNAVATGRVTALGVPAANPTRLPEALPPVVASWPIMFAGDAIEPGQDASPADHDAISASARFTRVCFKATELWAAFPPPPKAVATIAAEGRLQAWLEAEMRASLSVSPGKEATRARAAGAGHAFTGDGFNRAWAAAVKATGAAAWSTPGRKSNGANRKAK